jgi:hypothetical protein
MSNPITSFQDVIELWPARSSLAADLDLPAHAVRDWHRRDSIPVWHFDDVVAAAARRDFPGVTYALLTKFKKQ